MNESFVLYGANGYTGQLILEEALARGLRPVLAGRRAEAIEPIARQHGLRSAVVALEDREGLATVLRPCRALLLAAGPFSRTSALALAACESSGTAYLDVTGEIGVFEALFARRDELARSGVAALPGVGFDVVPSDCLAAELAGALPGAVKLQLAFRGFKSSAGTARTVAEGLPKGGAARIGGKLVPVPAAWKTLEVPFSDRRRLCVSIPWGDLSTAWRSTGIPNIETYMAMPESQIRALRLLRPFLPLAGLGVVQAGLRALIDRNVHGPTAEERASGRSYLWGRVEDASGRSMEGTLETLEGYSLTAVAAVACLERVLKGDVRPGVWTPSQAFGSRFVTGLRGTLLRVPA